MGQVGDLVGAEGAAAAGMVGPAEYPRLEEGAIEDQLTAALEQIEEAYFALGSFELVLLVDGQPRHAPALGGQRVTGAGEGLLFYEKLLVRSLPLLLRHDRWRVKFQVLLHGFCFVPFHGYLLFWGEPRVSKGRSEERRVGREC